MQEALVKVLLANDIKHTTKSLPRSALFFFSNFQIPYTDTNHGIKIVVMSIGSIPLKHKVMKQKTEEKEKDIQVLTLFKFLW